MFIAYNGFATLDIVIELVTACILLISLIRIRKALKTRKALKINEKNMAIHLIAFFLYVIVALFDKMYIFDNH